MTIRSRILGTGLGVPSKVLTNDDLAKFVETSDEWIRTRTGIRERRIIDRDQGETLSSLGVQASREALERAGFAASDLDLILCCTATPDTIMPNSAARIAGALGAARVGVIDLNAACSGFVTGLHVADGLIRSGLHKRVLVIGADVFSTILDWQDRKTCVLFGDGAGAAIMGATESVDPATDSCVLASRLEHVFDEEESLAVLGGGSRVPFNSSEFNQNGNTAFVQMHGQEVFKMGTRSMAQIGREVVEAAGYRMSDIDWLVPHQANFRIIEMVAKLMDFPVSKTYVNVDRWGNTSAATVAICLAEMEAKGLLKKGQLVLLDVFGGGFTYGAMLLRW
jgi:3-oxoacyl-[acyl-carrier-protein] synthase-3